MHATACLAAKNNCLAAKNKCLAESNRTRTESKATNKRLHPGTPRSADRGRVRQLPRWRGPTSEPERKPTSLHATHELEGDCARCGTAGRYQDAISRARPARAPSANRHLHGLLHRTRGTPPAGGAPTAALRRCRCRPNWTRWRVAPPAGSRRGILTGGRQNKSPARGSRQLPCKLSRFLWCRPKTRSAYRSRRGTAPRFRSPVCRAPGSLRRISPNRPRAGSRET